MPTIFSTFVSGKDLDASTEFLDALLDKIAKGGRNALTAIYRAMSDSVYGFALPILKNTHDARDVLQDCYLHIYSAAHTYRSR